MITLPTVISNNRLNTSFKPVFMVDFVDLNYEISNQSFDIIASGTDISWVTANELNITSGEFVDWNAQVGDTITIDGVDRSITEIVNNNVIRVDTTYFDDPDNYSYTIRSYIGLIKKKSNIKISSSVPQLLNSVVGSTNLTLKVAGWKDYIRGVIGSTPDLTDSVVEVYFTLDVGNDIVMDDRVRIFKGKLSNYSVSNDIVTFNIKTTPPGLSAIPGTLIPNETEIAEPLQFGGFQPNNVKPFFFSQSGGRHYAKCPLYYWDEEEQIGRYEICQQAIDTVPDDTEFGNIGLTVGQSSIFVVRDNLWVQVTAGDSGASESQVVNSGGNCYVEIDFSSENEAYIYLHPTGEGQGNEPTDYENAIDGDSSTEVLLDDSNAVLHVTDLGADNLRQNALYTDGAIDILVVARVGTVTGTNSFRLSLSNGTNTTSALIGSSSSDGYVTAAGHASIASWKDLQEYYVIVEQLTAGQSCEVVEVFVRCRVQPITSSDQFVYLSTIGGIEFGATWNGRKIAAVQMDYPTEFIEWMLRNSWGYDDENIDMDSFDVVNDFWRLDKFVISSASIVEQQDSYKLLKDICKSFNMMLLYSIPDNKWRIKFPSADLNAFSSSGTDTPNNTDIFSDQPTVSNGVFNYNPILKDSFSLKRSSESERYERVVLNYRYTANYMKRVSTGSGKVVTINNKYIARDDSAENLLPVLGDWLLHQKWIAIFKSSLSAIGHEVGDVINIRHDDLNNTILHDTVNTQKWMILDIDETSRPFYIGITAIELIN